MKGDYTAAGTSSMQTIIIFHWSNPCDLKTIDVGKFMFIIAASMVIQYTTMGWWYGSNERQPFYMGRNGWGRDCVRNQASFLA